MEKPNKYKSPYGPKNRAVRINDERAELYMKEIIDLFVTGNTFDEIYLALKPKYPVCYNVFFKWKNKAMERLKKSTDDYIKNVFDDAIATYRKIKKQTEGNSDLLGVQLKAQERIDRITGLEDGNATNSGNNQPIQITITSTQPNQPPVQQVIDVPVKQIEKNTTT